MRRPTVVVLDHPGWADNYRYWLSDVLRARHIELAGFTDDRDAAEFVCSRHRDVIGYIQDICRQDIDRGHRVGIDFFEAIIRFLTPHAWTIFISACFTTAQIRELAQTDGVAHLFIKTSFDRSEFADVVESQLRIKPPAPAALLSSSDAAIHDAIAVPWRSVRRFLGNNPNLLHKLPPREFERLVGELYRDFGWSVELTTASRDGGYDLVALSRTAPHQLKVLVEVKRFSPDRPVGVGLVRSIYGTRVLRHASQVVIVTSSHISAYAKREFRRAIPYELSFVERDALLAWCSSACACRAVGFHERHRAPCACTENGVDPTEDV